jgi:hypothetical protein
MKLADKHTFLKATIKAVLGLGVVWLCAALLDVDGLLRNEIGVNLGIYAISRTLNAAISVVQSAEVSLVVAKVDVGELLDPVNDAVERFSTVMTWATASLLVQKFIITLVGSTAYKMIATLAAFIYLIAVASGLLSGRIAAMAKSAFEFLGWITLASVLAVWVSISLTSEWLGDSLKQAERDLQVYKLEAIQLQGLVTGNFITDIETSEAIEDQITSVSESLEDAQARLSAADDFIVDLESKLAAARPERSWIEVIRRPFGDDDTSSIQTLEADLLNAQEQQQTIEFEIETLVADLACMEKQLAGETCEGLLGRLSAFTEGVAALTGKSPELIVSLMDVLAAVIFKNLLAPILLAYIILKFGPGWITWRSNLTPWSSAQDTSRKEMEQISKQE